MKNKARLFTLVFGALLFAITANSQNASAQTCNGSFTDLSFGTVNLLSSSPHDTSVNYSVTCSGGTEGQQLLVCPNFGAGSGGANGSNAPRYLKAGANELGFNLFTDAGHTTVWGAYNGGGSVPQHTITLGPLGTGSDTGTVYGLIYSGQQSVPTGGYASLFDQAPNAFVAWEEGAPNCAAVAAQNATGFRMNVTATYIPTCTVDVTDMDFGMIMSTTSPRDATATITATCSASSPYAISAGDGMYATGAQQRRLSFGGNFVSYGLYKDVARTQIWGNTLATRQEATGAGSGQNYTIYGRIPAQATPYPGTYTDTVIVTVSF